MNVRDITYQITADYLWISFEYTIIFKLKLITVLLTAN